MIIAFVSEAYMKSFTPIGDLVEFTELKSSIELSQDSFIQDILGTNFYVYLQGIYSAQTLNTNEIELVNRLKPALAYRVASEALPFINYQIKNKGLLQQSGDYSQSADLDATKYVRNELANRAEFYAKRLSTYLCENSTLFPQYITDNGDDMSPNKGGYDGGGLAFWF
jgi:hypothetical protein